MGLTSSQGRLLMLTSRLSDIQLDEILISQRQNQLAWQSEKVAKEYNEKMSNMKLVMKMPDKTTQSGYSNQDLTYDNMTSMGYIVSDAFDRIYLTKNEKGDWIVPKADNLTPPEMFDGEVYEKDDGKSYIKLKNGSKIEEHEVVDGTETLKDKGKLQADIMNGVKFVINTNEPHSHAIKVNQLESDTNVQWVQDTSDDAEAESKYNYETARISRQDNMLDMEMKQLETQHNAIIKELESVEKVIDDNVKRTFDIYSGS